MNEATWLLATNFYGHYCVPKSSAYTYTSRTILDSKVHEPQTIEFIMNNCGDGEIIHAGTGFGDFLPALSKACKKNVWAFEPNIENFECAQKTIELNQLTNIQLFNFGLGKSEQEAELRIQKDSKKLGPRSEIYAFVENEQKHDFETIKIIPLDQVIPSQKKVSIIHLDVEGYEPYVLDGAKKLIDENHPIIILEIHSEALKYNEYMEKIGYFPCKQLIYDSGPMVFVNTVYERISE